MDARAHKKKTIGSSMHACIAIYIVFGGFNIKNPPSNSPNSFFARTLKRQSQIHSNYCTNNVDLEVQKNLRKVKEKA